MYPLLSKLPDEDNDEDEDENENEGGAGLGRQNKGLKSEVSKHKQELEHLQQKVVFFLLSFP